MLSLPNFLQAPLIRERDRIRGEIIKIHGLLPLLMKERNGERWTPDERAQLRRHFRTLTGLSPYLLVLLAPGSFMLVPALAWWLDRRRQKRNGGGQTGTPIVVPLAEEIMSQPQAEV